ncbi:MAG: glycosyltransferase family 2 protein [bacterium]
MVSTKQKVVIIIPTYNESGNVKNTSQALQKVFRTLPSIYDPHILFVDDSSPDGTALVVREIIKTHPNVHLLLNKTKSGLGGAYKKGMRYSMDKLSADVMFEFDADLSHDPTQIPAMLAKISEGYDMVMGSRYISGGGIPSNWGFHRKFLSVVGNTFIRTVMLNFKLHDWTTGYRAIKSSVAVAIVPELQSSAFSGYTWQIGFLIKSLAAGFKVAEVPFKFVDRTYGHSKLGPEYIVNTIVYIMKVRLDQIFKHRLFKFIVTGGTGALVQFMALYLYRRAIPYQLAFFLAIETAVVSNFILSNIWTFADRKLKAKAIPGKFVQFNLASGGSILIQQTIAFLGERFIGLVALFTVPIINMHIDTGMMFAVVGILVGMFWNFFAYNHFIWRSTSTEAKKK